MTTFVCACALSLVACASGQNPTLPHGWTEDSNSNVNPQHMHTLRFHLTRNKTLALDAKVGAVSDPSSPEYRVYLTHAAISALVAPREGVADALLKWLAPVALVGREQLVASKHGDFISVTLPVRTWEYVFGSFAWLTNTRSKNLKPVLRLAPSSGAHVTPQRSSHHVPDDLAPYVLAIFGLTDLVPPLPTRPSTTCNQFKGQQIDPDVLATQYRMPAAGKDAKGSQVCVPVHG